MTERLEIDIATEAPAWLETMPDAEAVCRRAAHAAFAAAGSRIDAAGSRIDAAGSRIDAAGSRIDAAGSRIDAAGSRIDAAGSRIDAAGSRIDAAGSRIDAAGSRIDAAGSRIDAAGSRIDAAEVSLMLADDGQMRALNRDYRGEDRPTNVLSFAALDGAGPKPPTDGTTVLGDVVLAYQTIAAEAAGDGLALAHHLSHLVVHGMLHLLGYDHRTDAEAAAMERLEVRVLAGLGVPNPYAARTPE